MADAVGADLFAGCGGEVDLGKGVVNPWQQAEFTAHVAEPGKARHLRWKPGNRGDQGNLEVGEWLHGF